MKKTRVVMSTAFSAVLLGTTALPAYAGAQAQGEISAGAGKEVVQKARTDWSGHWAEAVVNKWKSAGWVGGYPDGSFRPDQPVTRSEFVTVINKIFGFYALGQEKAFADVQEGRWYTSDLYVAREAGYYLGYPDQTARPDQEISREDAAVLLARTSMKLNETGRWLQCGRIACEQGSRGLVH